MPVTNALKVTVAPDSIALRPGQTAEVDVTIQNASQAVEHYSTSLVGIPEDMYTCEPATVRLRPSESGAVRMRITLPERAGPGDGGYVLGVLVRSPYERTVSRCEELRLEVMPAPAVSMTAQPEVAVGGATATYALSVANEGNTPLVVTLDGKDPEGVVGYAFRPRNLQVPPGASGEAELTVRATPPWTGQEKRHSVTIRAVAGHDLEAQKPVTFVQRPRVAGGLLRLAGIATGVAVLATATIGAALLTRARQEDRPPAQTPAGTSQTGAVPGPVGQASGGASGPSASGGPSNPVTSGTPAPPPGTSVVVDFTQLPGGAPAGNQIIPPDLYAKNGVTLSTVTDRAPTACRDATALALRTGRTVGSFLTSARPAGADLCNVLPVRMKLQAPARAVQLAYVGTGVQYTMTVELSNGGAQPVTGVVQNGATGTLSFDAPAGVSVTSVVFGHTNPDPNANEPTLIKRLTYTT